MDIISLACKAFHSGGAAKQDALSKAHIRTVLLWGTVKMKTSWDCNTFPENGSNERKYPVSCCYLEERALMMPGVRGKSADWLNRKDKIQFILMCDTKTPLVPRQISYNIFSGMISVKMADEVESRDIPSDV